MCKRIPRLLEPAIIVGAALGLGLVVGCRSTEAPPPGDTANASSSSRPTAEAPSPSAARIAEDARAPRSSSPFPSVKADPNSSAGLLLARLDLVVTARDAVLRNAYGNTAFVEPPGCRVQLRLDPSPVRELKAAMLEGSVPVSLAETRNEDEWILRSISDGKPRYVDVRRRIAALPVSCSGEAAEEECIREVCASLRPVEGSSAELAVEDLPLFELQTFGGQGGDLGNVRIGADGTVVFSGLDCPRSRGRIEKRDARDVSALLDRVERERLFAEPPPASTCLDCIGRHFIIRAGGRVQRVAFDIGAVGPIVEFVRSVDAFAGRNPCSAFPEHGR